jgi:hypothetical protein
MVVFTSQPRTVVTIAAFFTSLAFVSRREVLF